MSLTDRFAERIAAKLLDRIEQRLPTTVAREVAATTGSRDEIAAATAAEVAAQQRRLRPVFVSYLGAILAGLVVAIVVFVGVDVADKPWHDRDYEMLAVAVVIALVVGAAIRRLETEA